MCYKDLGKTCFILSQSTHFTDGQTADTFLVSSPHWHAMQHGKKYPRVWVPHLDWSLTLLHQSLHRNQWQEQQQQQASTSAHALC